MNIDFSTESYPVPASPASISFSTSSSTPHSPVDSHPSDALDWSDQEDQLLRSLVIADREKNWSRVASRLNISGRDGDACLQRWQYLVESEGARKVRGRWTAEEDDHLASLVHEHGTRNWRAVASHLPGRLPKQCRERWHNQLDPTVRKDGLSAEEWKILHEAHAKYGNKWAEIVKVLPGRTANHVKNQWNTMIRRRESETSKKRKWGDVSVNASHSCDATATDSNDESSTSECGIEHILISPKRPKLMDDSVLTPPLSPMASSNSMFDVLVAVSLLRAQGVEDFPPASLNISEPTTPSSSQSSSPTLPNECEDHQKQSSGFSISAPSDLSKLASHNSNSSFWNNYVDVLAQQTDLLADHPMQLVDFIAPAVSKAPAATSCSTLDSLCSIAFSAAFKTASHS